MAYTLPSDEAVRAAIERVLARHGTVEKQHRLGELVRRQLRRKDPAVTVSDARVRRLALEAGLARLEVTTGTTDRPAPEQCPVCGAHVQETKNRTLDGEETIVGTRCPKCPYRSGPTREVPLRYTFHAVRERTGRARGPF